MGSSKRTYSRNSLRHESYWLLNIVTLPRVSECLFSRVERPTWSAAVRRTSTICCTLSGGVETADSVERAL